MTSLQKLLLVPCLSPLVMALLVASLNGSQPVAMRFLTWRSSKLPIGAWIALASTSAALFSSLAALSTAAANPTLRRQVHRPMGWGHSTGPAWTPEMDQAPFTPHRQDAEATQPPTPAWPERDIRDPAPTVAVPFRVIQRGSQSASTKSRTETDTSTVQSPTTSADDWGEPISDDW